LQHVAAIGTCSEYLAAAWVTRSSQTVLTFGAYSAVPKSRGRGLAGLPDVRLARGFG
jgi:hypothetical protein